LRLLQEPVDTTVAEECDAAFGVTAAGSPSIGYQWRKDGLPIPGAHQAFLRIDSAGWNDVGVYDVVVRASCGQLVSDAVTLTLTVRADLDTDGDVDQEDFGVFQVCLGGPNQPPGCP